VGEGIFKSFIMKRNKTIEAEFFYGTSPEIMERAKALRKNLTSTESKIWNVVNKRQIKGMYFRRQHPINRFIADFYCHEKRLVIEIDGGIHLAKTQKERDEGRDYFMNQLGLTVIRFTNGQVEGDLQEVAKSITKACL